MGWNSWDCFGTSVTESQAKAAADYMATNLKQFGYEYVVVDLQWYDPVATGFNSDTSGTLAMDGNGRLLPAQNRFPSATNGLGFKPLADYVHGKGLKFGIHMMRGIPRQAYNQNTPILGTSYHARDITDTASVCRWNIDMYGVDVSRPGAQEYFNSVLNLWATWGVDFIKIDDLSSDPGLMPYPYRTGEIEAYRTAIDQSGRQIVFSTSPGATPLGQGPHVMRNANMWRISDDFWDNWAPLLNQFGLVQNWTAYRRPGHFPDADMLPLGRIGAGNADPNGGRTTNFTVDEQYTLMTLWAIAQSPLMYGGDLTRMDSFTLGLITNPEVIAVDQNSTGNTQLFNQNGLYAWVANVPGSTDKYLALFNTRDAVTGQTGTTVTASLASVGFSGTCQVRDLWQRTDLGSFTGQFSRQINWHGAGLYRISGQYLPLPPNTLAAARGNHQVGLVWDTTSGATSYDVSRSATSGGPYALTAGGIATTSFVDSGLANASPYYYVVSAHTGNGPSASSTEVSAVPVGASASDWTTLDIGFPSVAGDAGVDDNIYTVRGGGDEIANAADNFRFCWQRMNGDGTLIARVRSIQQNADFWAKAGVMFREDGTPGSREVLMYVTPTQVVFQNRSTPNGGSTGFQPVATSNSPRWVKLIRKGNTFYGSYSFDGMAWTAFGNVTVAMAQSVLTGLAVTAHNQAVVTTASFDSVNFVPASSVPSNGSARVVAWSRSGSDAFLVVPSVIGSKYQLQKTSFLQSWQNIGAAQDGTGDLLTFFDAGGATGQRVFYHVTRTP